MGEAFQAGEHHKQRPQGGGRLTLWVNRRPVWLKKAKKKGNELGEASRNQSVW